MHQENERREEKETPKQNNQKHVPGTWSIRWSATYQACTSYLTFIGKTLAASPMATSTSTHRRHGTPSIYLYINALETVETNRIIEYYTQTPKDHGPQSTYPFQSGTAEGKAQPYGTRYHSRLVRHTSAKDIKKEKVWKDVISLLLSFSNSPSGKD